MSGCCSPQGHDAIFDERFARSVADRYRRRGLTAAQRQIIAFLSGRGVEGATVLEVGGGAGEIGVELLKLGAAHVTTVELVSSYDAEAASLLEAAGLTHRARRLQVNIALDPDAVEAADIVVLHRVVCCYPDHEGLLASAAGHTGRLLVFSHPPRNLATMAYAGAQNLMFRLAGHGFKTFIHPPAEMLANLARQGLAPVYRHRGALWQVVGFSR